jgi:large subunit ribosomal protein L4
LRRGGGVIFGPHPRDYRQDMPKKMRRLAIRCLLSAKAGAGNIKVVDAFNLSEAKAKEMAALLKTLGIESSALIATDNVQDMVVKSARNLSRVKTSPANLLNVLDLLKYDTLLLTEPAVQQVESLWGSAKGEAK